MELAKPWEGLNRDTVITETAASILGVWPNDCDLLHLQGNRGHVVVIERHTLIDTLYRSLDDPSIRLIHRVSNEITDRRTDTRLAWEPPLILRHWWATRLAEATETDVMAHAFLHRALLDNSFVELLSYFTEHQANNLAVAMDLVRSRGDFRP